MVLGFAQARSYRRLSQRFFEEIFAAVLERIFVAAQQSKKSEHLL
jgi:hypothetical protein